MFGGWDQGAHLMAVWCYSVLILLFPRRGEVPLCADI